LFNQSRLGLGAWVVLGIFLWVMVTGREKGTENKQNCKQEESWEGPTELCHS
jgi:hypothetical protein